MVMCWGTVEEHSLLRQNYLDHLTKHDIRQSAASSASPQRPSSRERTSPILMAHALSIETDRWPLEGGYGRNYIYWSRQECHMAPDLYNTVIRTRRAGPVLHSPLVIAVHNNII